MTNELTIFEMPKGQELRDLISFCDVMGNSPFYKRLGSGGVMSIILSAKELGLPMMACLNGGMYNIEGRVFLSAQLMNAMLLKNGHSIDLAELTDEKCTINFKRKGESKAYAYTYTFEEAKRAGYLGKNNWKAHLKDMLYCRCLSGGARKFMPDALLGCYVHHEIADEEIPTIDLPIEQPAPQAESVNAEEKPQVEFQKPESFDEFVATHDLLNADSEKARYVSAVVETSNKGWEEVISYAVQNEARFLEAFEKWNALQKKLKA